ncbi:hypothetical protein BDW22DRAFT_1362297 [Trametopsis cervina]|nr:hypothetical protein BDW22DRAFT_1362297 [Trametopsis cervina]
MGSWDELCLLCGVCAAGGPHSLLSKFSLEKVAKQIAAEMKKADDPEMLQVITNAFEASFSPNQKLLGFHHEWLPDGVGSVAGETLHYSTDRCIAIGYFDPDEGFGTAPCRGDLIPDGKNVQIRQVGDCAGGSFSTVIRTRGWRDEREEYVGSGCSSSEDPNPNFDFCQRCYYYLKCWLDMSTLPPPSNQRSLPFAGELYELINSRAVRRDFPSGLLPAINYDGIEATLEQWQSFFIPARRGTKHLARAIDAGLRGKELLPAILQDCRVWMFMRPDVWPTPSPSAEKFAFKSLTPSSTASPAIGNLPNELLLPILHDLPIFDLLSLASTCRALRQLILDPPLLNRILQESILRGSCQWILPVHGLLDEDERAFKAMRLWLPENVRPEDIPDEIEDEDEEFDEEEDEENTKQKERPERVIPPVKPLILDPNFPTLSFVRACWESDSMMNRKRLWGQVKQFEELWQSYRLNGWEVDRFFPSEEILDRLNPDPVEYRPACER